MYPSGGQHFSVDYPDVVEELIDAFEGDGLQLDTMNQNQNIVIALSVALVVLLYTFDLHGDRLNQHMGCVGAA